MSGEYEIRLFIWKPVFIKHICHWSILWWADGYVNYHEMYAVAWAHGSRLPSGGRAQDLTGGPHS